MNLHNGAFKYIFCLICRNRHHHWNCAEFDISSAWIKLSFYLSCSKTQTI